MGKQNRSKRRKSKASFNKSPMSLLDAKETFISNLLQIFQAYLKLFEKSVCNRIDSKAPISFTQVNLSLKPQNCELFCQHDESREFHHIFYAHLQKFLSQILLALRDLDDFDHKLIVPCVNDAFILLENARGDIESVTKFLFNSSGIDCKSMIFLIFHENLIKDRFVQRIIQEDKLKDEEIFGFVENNWIFDEFTVKTHKKRKRKGKKMDCVADEFDEEVMLFEQRLMSQKNLEDKMRPNVSQEWIQELKRTLKGVN